MKKFPLIVFAAIAAAFLIACGPPPANNTPTNTNTAKPTAAAPTADALLALDKGAYDAYLKGDAKYFETFLSDKAGGDHNGKHETKADILKGIAAVKCDVKDGWSLDKSEMAKIDDDTYALTYVSNLQGSCTADGHTEKMDKPVRNATVFVRNGDKWQAAWHSEVAVAEAKPDASGKKDEKADSAKPADTKKEEPKKEAAKPEAKKDDKAAAPSSMDKKDEAKKDDKAAPASNTGATAEAKPDANTDALAKIELAGWNAWKDKDAKALDAMAAKNLAWVDPSGKWFGTRADVLKAWDGSNCEKITKADIKDAFAWALSPTVEVLTFEATTDGSCDGMKNGPLEGASVYVKEGDAWKIAFGFLEPKKKM